MIINEDPLKNSQDARSEQCKDDARQNGSESENKSTISPSLTAQELMEDTAVLGIGIKSEIAEDPPYINTREGDTLIGKSDRNMFVKPDQKSRLNKSNVSEEVIKHGETLNKMNNKERTEKHNQMEDKKQKKASKIWKCLECPQTCPSNSQLIIHNRTHTGINSTATISAQIKYSLDSLHATAYIASMIIFLSILAYQKAVQHPGF